MFATGAVRYLVQHFEVNVIALPAAGQDKAVELGMRSLAVETDGRVSP